MRMRSEEERAKAAMSETLPEWEGDPVQGYKYLRMLDRHVVALRAKSAPDPHGNQQLFLNDVVVAHLFCFFNPSIKSLRNVEDFSQTRQAQGKFKAPKISRTTLSDFHKVVDPQLLQPIVAELTSEARKRGSLPAGELEGLPETVTRLLAIDGSFFAVAANVAWAVQHACNNGKKKASVRFDVHLNINTWVPEHFDVHGKGTSEAESASRHIEPGSVRIEDRGILSFKLIQAEVDAKAFFVHRLLKPGERTPKFDVIQEFSLTREQRDAGVIADRLVRFCGSTHREAPDAVLREVVLASPGEDEGEIRLLTNFVDATALEPTKIGQLYRYRWQVELFFRWLKTFAHFEHMISHSRPGVLLSFYVAVIGVLLMCLVTGTHLSKYAHMMMSLVANGSATLEEIMPILAERHRQIAVDKASKAKRDAKKKHA
jgi:Transposase DDE domain